MTLVSKGWRRPGRGEYFLATARSRSLPMKAGNIPLWTCPRRGHRFVTRNLWHSCGRYRLADPFRDKDPVVRRLFDRFRVLARQCGPVTVYVQKTRIVFQGRVRFAGAIPRKHWLNGGLWLTHRHRHHTVQRVEYIAPRCYLHQLRIESPADMDHDFIALVRSAIRWVNKHIFARIGHDEPKATRSPHSLAGR